MKNSFRLFSITIFSLLISSCGTNQWWTTTEGHKVWVVSSKSLKLSWNGGATPDGFANGAGRLTESGNDFLYGNHVYRQLEGIMKKGKFDGNVSVGLPQDGQNFLCQYVDGDQVSYQRVYSSSVPASASVPGSGSGSGSSGLSDGQLVGGMFGLAGLAGGDVGLAGAGLTVLSGDERGGLQKMNSWAKSEPGGTSASGALPGVGGAGIKVTEKNLIDEWKLRGTVKTGGDHMKYYIQAADQAYASYQKSGEKAYYTQHQEYASLARDFHERTGTETQGYSR